MRRPTLIAAASIAGLIVLFAPPVSSGRAGPAKSVPPSVRNTISHFGAFRSPRRPFDRIPRDRRAYWRALRKTYGVRIAGARRVLDLNRGRVWLLPGAGYLCMDAEDKRDRVTIGGCARTWKARRGLVSLSVLPRSGRLIVIGAVPDRARHLRVVSAHHPPVPVRIANNAYHFSIPPAQRRRWKPRKIAFVVGHNRHRFTIAGHPGSQHGALPALRRASG
jgi:hypothetical protein